MSSSVSSSTTVYVVTGASRGIGLGLVQQLAITKDTLVYAGARDASKADKLQQLAKQHANVRVVQLSAESDDDHAALLKQVEAEAGRVDVLIPNAAIAMYEKTGELDLANMRSQYEVNALGPVRLFQACLPLLARSSKPRFVPITSVAGSIAAQPQIPAGMYMAGYGSSKAALNHIVVRVHLEHPSLTAFVVHPGWVQTDGGNAGAKAVGMEQAPTTIEDCCSRILQIVDQAKRDTHGGKFWDADHIGTDLPW